MGLLSSCGNLHIGSVAVLSPSSSSLSYSTNPARYIKNTTISMNSPASSTTSSVTYSASPALPTGLSLDSVTGVITGTPIAALGATNYTITARTLEGSTTAILNLSVSRAADHLVLISGASQVGTVGTALSQSMKVQLVDVNGTPVAAGITLGLMRILGVDSTGYSSSVTTDSSGYASFNASYGFSPSSSQITPIGTTLPASNTGGRGIAIGDFDGNRKLDLTVANSSVSFVSILLGL